MAQWHRELARKAFRWAGLDVRSLNRWGIGSLEDIRRVIGVGPHTLLDVGANSGQTAVQWLAHFPRSTVLCFEPIPAEVAKLRALAQRMPGVTVLPYALGSEEGEMSLNVAADTVGSSLLPWAIEPGAFGSWTVPASRVSVQIRRLDAALEQLNVDRASLLKIDTQGFDLEVLKGAGRMLNPDVIGAVMVELNFRPYYAEQAQPHAVLEFLAARRYRPVGMYTGARDETGRLDWADMVFA